MTACLNNASLVDAFNLSDAFDFSDVELPVIELDVVEMPADVTDSLNDLTGLTLADLGWDDSIIDSQIDALNTAYDNGGSPYTNYPVGGWIRSTVVNIDPNDVSDPTDKEIIRAHKWNILTSIDTEDYFNNMIVLLSADATAINTELDDLETDLTDIGTTLNNTLAELSGLFDDIDTILGLARCQGMGDEWIAFKETFCDVLSVAISYETIALLMVGLFTVLQLPVAVKVGNGIYVVNHENGEPEDEHVDFHVHFHNKIKGKGGRVKPAQVEMEYTR